MYPFTKFNSTSVVNQGVNIIGVDVQCIFRDNLGLEIKETNDYVLCGIQMFQVKSVNFIVNFIQCGEFDSVDFTFFRIFANVLRFTVVLLIF